MKKILYITVSFTLIITLLFGYTGIPVYKMICSEDGHVEVSMLDAQTCEHHESDCCMPVQKQALECCGFSSGFLQLHELTLVKSCQNSTGHLLTAYLVLFDEEAGSLLFTYHNNPFIVSFSPFCKLKPKQTLQSLTQNFRT